MPAWRMKPGVGASGSPTQNGSTSGLPRPSFTSSRILEAVSALTAARAINGVSNFTGYFRLPGDESSSYCLDPRLRFAVHGRPGQRNPGSPTSQWASFHGAWRLDELEPRGEWIRDG